MVVISKIVLTIYLKSFYQFDQPLCLCGLYYFKNNQLLNQIFKIYYFNGTIIYGTLAWLWQNIFWYIFPIYLCKRKNPVLLLKMFINAYFSLVNILRVFLGFKFLPIKEEKSNFLYFSLWNNSKQIPVPRYPISINLIYIWCTFI